MFQSFLPPFKQSCSVFSSYSSTANQCSHQAITELPGCWWHLHKCTPKKEWWVMAWSTGWESDWETKWIYQVMNGYINILLKLTTAKVYPEFIGKSWFTIFYYSDTTSTTTSMSTLLITIFSNPCKTQSVTCTIILASASVCMHDVMMNWSWELKVLYILTTSMKTHFCPVSVSLTSRDKKMHLFVLVFTSAGRNCNVFEVATTIESSF